jgi:hypothetical protein
VGQAPRLAAAKGSADVLRSPWNQCGCSGIIYVERNDFGDIVRAMVRSVCRIDAGAGRRSRAADSRCGLALEGRRQVNFVEVLSPLTAGSLAIINTHLGAGSTVYSNC